MFEILNIYVKPNSSKNNLTIKTMEDGTRQYCICVTAIPENGRANLDVIKLLSKEFQVPKSNIEILKGFNSKHKKIKINY